MSKTQLKKELEGLDRAQIVELITDLYSACKPAKEYLDFFCNPDVDKLYEKYASLITKECLRGKRSMSTARISKIKAHIRDFAAFGIDTKNVIDLMCHAIRQIILVERSRPIKQSLVSGCVKLIEEMLALADRSAIFSYATDRLDPLLDGSIGSRNFIAFLRRNIAEG